MRHKFYEFTAMAVNRHSDEENLLIDGQSEDDHGANVGRNHREKIEYDDAIAATGYGRFHYLLLLLCGWALCSDAIEILSMSFVLPPATCDLLLTDSDKGWLNASIFLGMMIGGVLWGTLADIHGRRAVLLVSLTINSIFGFCSSFSQTFWQLIAFRFLSGIGVGGSLPVIFTYFSEFQTKARLGSMVSILAMFWMLGNIIAAGLAFAMIPHSFGVDMEHFKFTSWNAYLAVCTLPSVTSLLLFFLMPESPKFLLECGRYEAAYEALQSIFHTNNPRSLSSDYQISHLQWHTDKMTSLRQSRSVCLSEHSGLRGCVEKFFTLLLEVMRSWGRLFEKSLRRSSVVMLIIFFTLSFGYYGLFMWFPELFRRGSSGCSAVNGSDSGGSGQGQLCTPPDRVYLEGFVTALANLPGNLLTIILIDRLGRKPLLVSSMVLSGLSVFFIFLLTNETQSFVMSCVFSGISTIGWNVLDVLCVELFPTALRSTATGFLIGAGRIAAICANVTFGQLFSLSCAIPMTIVAVLMCGGGLSALLLPNTRVID